MALSRPLANKPQLASACELSDLADADLSEVFKRLPPYDRLLTSEVCRRWLSISRKAWLEITHLDLSPIPGPNISAVIRQCPNLQTVFAERKAFALNELYILSRVPLRAVTLYQCSGVILASLGSSNVEDGLSVVFSSRLRNASWRELSLGDFQMSVRDASGSLDKAASVGLPASFPASLKRLQLSDWTVKYENRSSNLLDGLKQLQQLECLSLSCWLPDLTRSPIMEALHGFSLYFNIGALSNLRELYLGIYDRLTLVLQPIFCLARLEVLFLQVYEFGVSTSPTSESAWLKKLTSTHPTLRILVFKGRTSIDIELPSRLRYPNGLGSSPAPLLHIFLSKELSDRIRFPTLFDSAQIYPFDEPLAQLLEREDVKPIFEGVWIAEQIKEAAKAARIKEAAIADLNIGTALRYCSSSQTVFAKGNAFASNELKVISRIPLNSLTLCACSSYTDECFEDAFSSVFSSELRNASWRELSLRDFQVIFGGDATCGSCDAVGLPISLPTSLQRLQLSDLSIKRANGPHILPVNIFEGLERLQQLECLMLSNTRPEAIDESPIEDSLHGIDTYYKIEALSNLRELYLGTHHSFFSILQSIFRLPNLEVLFLHEIQFGCSLAPTSNSALLKLVSERPTLRILVLKGYTPIEIEFTPRLLYPNGLGSNPAPFLHIFLDKELSEHVRFPTPSDSAVIYTFNEPLAQFIEKKAIKPIFKGVWTAEKIKEAAKMDPN